jgi:hypothetical protein
VIVGDVVRDRLGDRARRPGTAARRHRLLPRQVDARDAVHDRARRSTAASCRRATTRRRWPRRRRSRAPRPRAWSPGSSRPWLTQFQFDMRMPPVSMLRTRRVSTEPGYVYGLSPPLVRRLVDLDRRGFGRHELPDVERARVRDRRGVDDGRDRAGDHLVEEVAEQLVGRVHAEPAAALRVVCFVSDCGATVTPACRPTGST